MAARQYSQFKSRKQTAQGSGSIPTPPGPPKSGKDHSVNFKTCDWSLKGVPKSNAGWGSDTAKVDTYVKCEGVS